MEMAIGGKGFIFTGGVIAATCDFQMIAHQIACPFGGAVHIVSGVKNQSLKLHRTQLTRDGGFS